jgi:hypothetical protein
MKEDDLSRTCCRYEGNQRSIQNFGRKISRGDLGVNRTIILKWVSE